MTLELRLSAVVAFCFLIGCGGQGHVTGTVTHNGEPVPFGTIVFQPDESQGNSGPAVTAEIINGKYDTSKSGGGGVSYGAVTVTIEGYDGVPGGAKKGVPAKKPSKKQELDPATGQVDPTALYGSPLFGKYTTKVEITSDSHDFKVP